jgi:hypothetical protein
MRLAGSAAKKFGLGRSLAPPRLAERSKYFEHISANSILLTRHISQNEYEDPKTFGKTAYYRRNLGRKLLRYALGGGGYNY